METFTEDHLPLSIIVRDLGMKELRSIRTNKLFQEEFLKICLEFILEDLRERERPEGTAKVEEDVANNEEFCHFFNNKF